MVETDDHSNAGLVLWLRNQYARHHEIEDKLAADRIEQLERDNKMLGLWQALAWQMLSELRQAYAPGAVGDNEAPDAIRRLALRTEKAERELAEAQSDRQREHDLRVKLAGDVEQLQRKLSEARRKALEEAAKACDELSLHGDPSAAHGCVHCAAAIRAMQEPAQGCSLSPGKLET